jgi:5-methylcytosine-specific restriction endonuclease McrA
MPIVSRCSLCGGVKAPGQPCPACRRKRWSNQTREHEITAFYNSRGWGSLREATRRQQAGVDLLVWHEQGQIVLADVVHHIVPIRTDWGQRLDGSNLICLSDSSHKQIHDLLKHGGQIADEAIRRCREARAAWYGDLL